jgi:Arc/MetJ family transcription regulator
MCMTGSISIMGRTNIVIDDKLVARVMEMYGLRTKREAVDYALRRLAGETPERSESDGGTEGDWWARHFEAIRGHPVGE